MFEINVNFFTAVMDVWTSDTHEFTWNPEGTLARWTDPNAAYERVFTYDEEGRLTKIERDNGQSVTTAYEYTYTGDGIKAVEKHWIYVSGLPPFVREYRYSCSIQCGDVPLRVYQKINNQWESYEEYLSAPTFIRYGAVEEDQSYWVNGDYAWLPGHLLSDMITPIDFRQRVYDRFGVYVGSGFEPQKVKRSPFYLITNPDEPPLVWFPEPIERRPQIPSIPGPIDEIVNPFPCSLDAIDAANICRKAQTEFPDEWLEWCLGPSGCAGNADCCRLRCVEAVLGGNWNEFIDKWVDFYEQIWKRGCKGNKRKSE